MGESIGSTTLCMTFNKTPNFPMPQFPHLPMGTINSTHRVSMRIERVNNIKCLEQGLVHTNNKISCCHYYK